MKNGSRKLWLATMVCGVIFVSLVGCQKKETEKTYGSAKEESKIKEVPQEENELLYNQQEEIDSNKVLYEPELPWIKAKTDLRLSRVPPRGETADLTYSITPEEDLPLLRIIFALQGVEVVSGGLTPLKPGLYYTNAKANAKTEISLKVRFVGNKIHLGAFADKILNKSDPKTPGHEVIRHIEVHHKSFRYYFDENVGSYVTWGEFVAKPWLKFNPMIGDTEPIVDDGVSRMNLRWIDKIREIRTDITAWEALYLLYEILNAPYVTREGSSYHYPPKGGEPYPEDEEWAKKLIQKGWLKEFRTTCGESLLKVLPNTPFPPKSSIDWSKEHPEKLENRKESKKDGSFLTPQREERRTPETQITSLTPIPTQCTGTFLYKKYPYTSNYGLDSIPYDVPVREAVVAIWGYSETNITRRILGRDFTDENGNFNFYVDVDDADTNWRLYPVVYAMGPNDTNANLAAIKVSDPTPPAPRIGNAPEDSSVYHDVGNLNPNVPPGSSQYFDTTYFDPDFPAKQPWSGSINIYKALLEGFNYIVPAYTNPDTLEKVGALWEPDFHPYDTLISSVYHRDTVFICGDTSSIFWNTDEWDDLTLVHEYGHHVLANAAEHPQYTTLNHIWWEEYPNYWGTTYSEGWPTFFASVITDTIHWIDTKRGIGEGVASFVSVEDPWVGFDTTNLPDSFAGGVYCEGAVAGSLWDVCDSYNVNEDPYPSYPKPPLFPDTGLVDTMSVVFDSLWDVTYTCDPPPSQINRSWSIQHWYVGWILNNYGHGLAFRDILLHHRIIYPFASTIFEDKSKVEPARRMITLGWSDSTSQVIQGYSVYRKEPQESKFTRVATVSDTFHTDSTVIGGRTYTYTITSYDSFGIESDTSKHVTTWVPGSSNAQATAYNNGRKMVRDSTGTIFVTLSSGDSVLVGWTSNHASTWEKAFIGNGKSPSIALDPSNVPWVFWIGIPDDHSIYYSIFDTTGVWSLPSPLHTFPTNLSFYSLSSVFGPGYGHTTVDGERNDADCAGCRFSYYLRFDTSLLQVLVSNFRGNESPTPTSAHSSVDSDILDTPHIVWDYRQWPDFGIIYYLTGIVVNPDSIDWAPPIPISSDTVNSAYPFLDEFDGELDVVWQGYSVFPNWEIFHRSSTGGIWGNINQVTSTSDPSLYPVITAGKYAVWVEDISGNSDIWYSMYVLGAWGP